MKQHAILSGAITAPFHVDGSHLEYFLARKAQILSKLCEELALHEHLIVPCPDFLGAVGLAAIVGERGLIELLEQRRIEFVRVQGTMVYLRGTGPDGAILTMLNLEERKANTVPLDEAIAMGLAVAPFRLSEAHALSQLLLSSSRNEDARPLAAAAASDAYRDFRASRHWRTFYGDPDPERMRLPSVAKASGRVLSADAQSHNPVDVLLSFATNNLELLLAQKYACASVSTSSPFGEMFQLKLKRLTGRRNRAEDYWRILDVNGVPDVSDALLQDKEAFQTFLRLTGSPDARAFRNWFHETTTRHDADILKEYVGLLRQMPVASSWKAKSLRFAVTTALGLLGPLVGFATSALDTFVLDRVVRGNSPKFFVENLAKFLGERRRTKK